MATTSNLKRILHRKVWELCTPSMGPSNAVNTAAGSFLTSDKFNIRPRARIYFVGGASNIYSYDAEQDGWQQLPNSGIAGVFAAGSCGEHRALGALGGVFTQTATAGTTTTITTNRTITRVLKDVDIKVIAGTGAGYVGTITNNTTGGNAILTVSPANGVAFDATTQFQVYSGSLWFFNAGTTAVGFSVYDVATNSWTARSVTGLPTAWGTTGRLVSTMGSAATFATGTAAAGSTTTTLNGKAAANWLVNQWANYQVRITAGTGLGQVRIISSNTATTLTVSAAWTVTPDATSVYAIEGNDDYMYLLGNNAVTMYRFQVSTNTWTTLAPTAARAAAAAGGCSGNWIESVPTWALQSNDQPVALRGTTVYKQNGRYIFSWRGGGSSALDIYDIPLNTWYSAEAYGNQNETFTTGSSYTDYDGNVYIQKENTGRILRFEVDTWSLQTFNAHPYPQGTTIEGEKMCIIPYIDGSTKLPYLFTQLHTASYLLRMLIF